MSANRVPDLVDLFGEEEYVRLFENSDRLAGLVEGWRGLSASLKAKIAYQVWAGYEIVLQEHSPESLAHWNRKLNGIKRYLWCSQFGLYVQRNRETGVYELIAS